MTRGEIAISTYYLEIEKITKKSKTQGQTIGSELRNGRYGAGNFTFVRKPFGFLWGFFLPYHGHYFDF